MELRHQLVCSFPVMIPIFCKGKNNRYKHAPEEDIHNTTYCISHGNPGSSTQKVNGVGLALDWLFTVLLRSGARIILHIDCPLPFLSHVGGLPLCCNPLHRNSSIVDRCILIHSLLNLPLICE